MNANDVAKQRCEYLLNLAAKTYKKDAKLATRYVKLARKIAMRHRLKLGRRKFCKRCNSLFIVGETLKVRISAKEKSVIWKCVECGNIIRFPLFRKG